MESSARTAQLEQEVEQLKVSLSLCISVLYTPSGCFRPPNGLTRGPQQFCGELHSAHLSDAISNPAVKRQMVLSRTTHHYRRESPPPPSFGRFEIGKSRNPLNSAFFTLNSNDFHVTGVCVCGGWCWVVLQEQLAAKNAALAFRKDAFQLFAKLSPTEVRHQPHLLRPC
jgi:hypothetical protein